MKNRLRRNERAAVRNSYAEHPLWAMLQTPARSAESDMKLFRLTAEELFLETVCVLDNIKENPKDASLRMQGLWDEVFCDFRDLDTADAQEEELKLAATEVVLAVMFVVNFLDNALSAKLSPILMCQLIEKDAPDTDRLQKEFTVNLIRMGEDRICSWVAEYMQNDEWLSDEIADLLEAVPKEETKPSPDTSTKTQEQLTNRQLIILFEHFLNVPLKSEFTNINALAKLIGLTSGRSAGSIRGKINEGIDYDTEAVKEDVLRLADLVEPISHEKAEKLKNSIE